MFGYVFGGNDFNGIPTEFDKKFEISFTPSDDNTCPYKFRIYKRNGSGNLEVIPKRYYTYIKEDNDEKSYISIAWGIKSVQLLTKSQ